MHVNSGRAGPDISLSLYDIEVNMPAAYLWYFSQYNETLAQAHWSLVIQVYTSGLRKLRYLDDSGNAVTVDNVPHGAEDWQVGTYRTQVEAGQNVVDGGMSSFR